MNFLKNGNFAEKSLHPWEPDAHSDYFPYPPPADTDIHTVEDGARRFNALRLSPGGYISQWLDIDQVGENNVFLLKVKAMKAGQPRTLESYKQGALITSPLEIQTEVPPSKRLEPQADPIGQINISARFYTDGQTSGASQSGPSFYSLREWHDLGGYVVGPANKKWSGIQITVWCPHTPRLIPVTSTPISTSPILNSQYIGNRRWMLSSRSGRAAWHFARPRCKVPKCLSPHDATHPARVACQQISDPTVTSTAPCQNCPLNCAPSHKAANADDSTGEKYDAVASKVRLPRRMPRFHSA